MNLTLHCTWPYSCAWTNTTYLIRLIWDYGFYTLILNESYLKCRGCSVGGTQCCISGRRERVGGVWLWHSPKIGAFIGYNTSSWYSYFITNHDQTTWLKHQTRIKHVYRATPRIFHTSFLHLYSVLSNFIDWRSFNDRLSLSLSWNNSNFRPSSNHLNSPF
jgi:hypothetical protein